MKLSNFLSDTLPVRKGSVKIPIKSMIDTYRERYNNFLNTNKPKFSHKIYFVNPGGRRIIHVKVPSETVSNFFYDVLIELETIPSGGSRKIEDCDIRIFSNSPSFVYRYAYVFYHMDMNDSIDRKKKSKVGMIIDGFTNKIPKDRLLIAGSERKYPDQVIEDAPVVTNSFGLPLFDKSLYYAIFYLLDTIDLTDVLVVKRSTTELSLMRDVLDFDTLMAKRGQQALKDKEKKAAERKELNKKVDNITNKSKRGVQKISPIKRANSITKVGSNKKMSKPKGAVSVTSSKRVK